MSRHAPQERVLRRSDAPTSRTSWRELLSHARYALGRTAEVSKGLLVTLVTLEALRAVLPVAGALLVGLLVGQAKLVIDGTAIEQTSLPLMLAAVVVLMLLGTFSFLGRRYVIDRLADELRLHVTRDILAHVATLDLSIFENQDAQDRIERATRQPGRDLLDFVVAAIASVTQTVQVVSLLSILVWIEPLLTSVVIVSAVPLLLFRWHMARATYLAQRKQATLRRWSAYFANVMTNRVMIPTVKFFGLAPVMIDRFTDQVDQVMAVNTGIYRKQLIGGTLAASLLVLASVGLVIWVGRRTVDGELTLAELSTFAVAITRLPASVNLLVDSTSAGLERTLFISNLIELLEQRSRLPESAQAKRPTLRGEVRLSAVQFTYDGAEAPTIRGLDLLLEAGRTIALVGPNGCGKTTLAKLIARLYDVDSGTVTVDDIDVRQIATEHLHADIAYVSQQPTRFECTAADYIAYGDWDRLANDRAAVRELAERAHVLELIESMPDGFDTLLGRRFGSYDPSSGQWQRMAIARALANPAKILILDEPTASMDMQAEAEMYEGFKKLAAGRTTLLISHRFSTVAMADFIYVMEEGRITALGTHDELLRAGGMYAHFYELHRRSMEQEAS